MFIADRQKGVVAHIVRLNLKSRLLAFELETRAVFSLKLSEAFLRSSRPDPGLETFGKNANSFTNVKEFCVTDVNLVANRWRRSPVGKSSFGAEKICGNDSVAKVVMPLIRFPRYPYFDRNPLGRIKVINSLVFLMKRVGIINANDYHYVDFS